MRSRLYRSLPKKVGIKHVINGVQVAEAGATVRTIVIATGVVGANPTTNPTNIEAGHSVKSCFLDLNFQWGVTPAVNLNFYIMKIKAGQSAPTPGAEGTSSIRNQIIKSGMAMVSSLTPSTKFTGYIKIPPSLQKIQESEFLQLIYYYGGAGANANTCWKMIFKDEN